MSTGVEAIAAERQRQIDQEGWSIAHDNAHTDGSLAQAAACYALEHSTMTYRTEYGYAERGEGDIYDVPTLWPRSWHPRYWKRKDRRRDLVRAGALIAAEIDRLDRMKSDGVN